VGRADVTCSSLGTWALLLGLDSEQGSGVRLAKKMMTEERNAIQVESRPGSEKYSRSRSFKLCGPGRLLHLWRHLDRMEGQRDPGLIRVGSYTK
jgi:hypothetical protein